jgi:hypothetical protein
MIPIWIISGRGPQGPVHVIHGGHHGAFWEPMSGLFGDMRRILSQYRTAASARTEFLMHDDRLLRHPDLLAMSADFWREQIHEQRLGVTRRRSAVLVAEMRRLRDQMRELQERTCRIQARSDAVPSG